MLKTLYSRHGGAVTGRAAVILSVVMVVTGIFSLSAAKYVGLLNLASVTDNGYTVRRLTGAQTPEASTSFARSIWTAKPVKLMR